MKHASRMPLTGRRAGRLVLTLVLSAVFAVPAGAACIDEDRIEMRGNGMPSPADSTEPRLRLQNMVNDALRLSHAVGAARLLAEASADDIDATRAAARPQVTLGALVGLNGTREDGITDPDNGLQARANVNVSALLYDAGRNAELTMWRQQLNEAARMGQISTEEQIALQTVSLALERSRFRLQVRIYQQYQRKMSCLVEALEQIVAADRGRASELVQARKTEQQAGLLVDQTQAAVRSIETRLRRLVGDALPSPEGMSSLLLAPPDLNEIVAEADRAAEIVRLDASARAADSLARSVIAEGKPSANWVITGSQGVGGGNPSNWSAGISLNVPLVNPGNPPAASAARKRAEAARLQKADALEARRFRMAEVHDQAVSAFDRARLTVEVVRNSDRVRNFTLQQWQQLGKRSLFDVMGAEGEHYALRVAYVNALHDGQQSTALLRSLGKGINAWLQ